MKLNGRLLEVGNSQGVKELGSKHPRLQCHHYDDAGKVPEQEISTLLSSLFKLSVIVLELRMDCTKEHPLLVRRWDPGS